MPFKSEKQRRYLWMHEPAVARKWAGEMKQKKKKPKKRKSLKQIFPGY